MLLGGRRALLGYYWYNKYTPVTVQGGVSHSNMNP